MQDTASSARPPGRLPGAPRWERAPGRRRARPVLTLAAPDAPPPPPPPRRGRRRRATGWLWVIVLPVGVALAGLTVYAFSGSGPAPAAAVVVASVPYWNISHGTTAVLAQRGDINEVSPWMYGLGSGSQVQPDAGINVAATDGYLAQMRAEGLPIVPTLANVDAQGNWAYQPVARMIHDPALARRSAAAITALVQRSGYAGIDIDFEDLRGSDRAAFTSYLTQLAAALHAKGKILSVALFAKASNAGYAPRNVAQDYAAIGRVADQVRLMGYDYHWATSPPGPVAPVSWIRDVLRYARAQIPGSKIILGIPFYGYDWSGGHGVSVTWQQATALASRYQATLHYDTASQAPWFRYTDSSGHQHTVWFEDARSARAKFGLAHSAGIGGVYLWMYGNPDPATWAALHHVLPVGQHTAAPTLRSASS
jgi:spore germination protein YaaH